MGVECPFCERVLKGEYAGLAALGEHEVVMFPPLNPVTFGHMLFIPKTHVRSARENPHFAGACTRAAAAHGIMMGDEFNLITSAGPLATQSVEHLHVHYVPRRMGDGLHLPWTGQVVGG